MWTANEVLLLWLVLQAAATDLALRKIPNVLVLSGLLLALVLHGLAGPAQALLTQWLAGLLAGFFLFLPLYLLRGMAAGDVKLMAMVGAFSGPLQAVDIAVLSCLAGGALGVLLMAVSGRWRQGLATLRSMLLTVLLRLAGVPVPALRLVPQRSVGGMPYGVAVALGTAGVLLASHWRA